MFRGSVFERIRYEQERSEVAAGGAGPRPADPQPRRTRRCCTSRPGVAARSAAIGSEVLILATTVRTFLRARHQPDRTTELDFTESCRAPGTTNRVRQDVRRRGGVLKSGLKWRWREPCQGGRRSPRVQGKASPGGLMLVGRGLIVASDDAQFSTRSLRRSGQTATRSSCTNGLGPSRARRCVHREDLRPRD